MFGDCVDFTIIYSSEVLPVLFQLLTPYTFHIKNNFGYHNYPIIRIFLATMHARALNDISVGFCCVVLVVLQLAHVLAVFACFRPDIGYRQSTSFIAATLLLCYNGDELQSFISLVNMLTRQPIYAMLVEDELAVRDHYR